MPRTPAQIARDAAAAVAAGAQPVHVHAFDDAGAQSLAAEHVALLVLTLFSNDTWMYVPITMPLAAVVTTTLLLPRSTGVAPLMAGVRQQHLQLATDSWRTATVMKAHEAALEKDGAESSRTC
jgi:uncharacterized protein (DUF849 family)